MKLYTITATPVQSKEQMIKAGYDIQPDNTVEHINELHTGEYSQVVADILEAYGVNGFTIYPVQGYWMGKAEQSFKIEIAGISYIKASKICNELRDTYNQDAVMLTNPDGRVEFI